MNDLILKTISFVATYDTKSIHDRVEIIKHLLKAVETTKETDA